MVSHWIGKNILEVTVQDAAQFQIVSPKEIMFVDKQNDIYIEKESLKLCASSKVSDKLS